ncbi:M43 family zinc metalloprotease [Pedobacter psychrodurus]|uniref:M43 family zinc metalloprotease n=1 Tax=Pedobacter psychrodurus TaxID=2530456 RepID=UPI00292EFEB0|nr:M43 family zinc metalloprotease [Pedobacter psychrodurus]
MLRFFLAALFCVASQFVQAQLNCSSESYCQIILKDYPGLGETTGKLPDEATLQTKLAYMNGTIRIPVVVHLVYNPTLPDQKLSDEMIREQIEQLNIDFSAVNSDLDKVPYEFRSRIANCKFYFDLKEIKHVETSVKEFNCGNRNAEKRKMDPIKFSKTKGSDGLASTQYLNIWIGSINDGRGREPLLGYASPSNSPGIYDGIVLNYTALGSTALAATNPKIKKGRTLTHEVGHWLGLIHIWGDKKCGDDHIGDTPPQEFSSQGIPIYPRKSICSIDSCGDMFMNFMDLSADDILVMFTCEQMERMRSMFVEGGKRASFLHNGFINDITLVDQSIRNDAHAAVITNLIDIPGKSPGKKTGKYISWTPSKNAKSYIVLTRPIESKLWKPNNTNNNAITLDNLMPGETYEIIVRTFFDNDSPSTQSTPYIFETAKLLDRPVPKSSK